MTLPIKKKVQIKTNRLIIKPHSLQDVNSLAQLLTNQEIAKTFMVPEFENFEQAEQLAKMLVDFSQIEDTTHLEYGIYLDGKLIGIINNCDLEEDVIEIGYVIHPDYQGYGYATEAVKAVLNELFEVGFKTIKAGYFVENIASCRVMLKCGMTQTEEVTEVEYRGKWHVCRYCEIQEKSVSE